MISALSPLATAANDNGIHVLTWDPVCQRSVSIADRLGKELETIHYFGYRRPWIAPVKYPLQAARTLQSLFEQRPKVVMVSNPPPFAAWTVWLYCKATGSKFVLDAHTGVFLEPKWRPFLPLNRFLMQRAAMTLVTNKALQKRVNQWGGRGFVLPDPLPQTAPAAARFPFDRRWQFNIAAVFSFYEDEPVDEMLSVRRLPADTRVYVTGDSNRVSRHLKRQLSQQVHLCGFVPRSQYDALLATCNAVICLCTRPHTLLCGAYEAVAAGKPLITSESEAMRQYFRSGTIFVDNSTAGIEHGIRMARLRHHELTTKMVQLREDLRREWNNTFNQCLAAIE
ncbi:MAG TPA: glycosyltransferase [Terriglobales bacterium]|nr:glycosyltransferase [Terriglobales bacterium]